MSIFEQKQLLASIHPFDYIDDNALEKLMTQMDIAYYPKDTVLIGPRLRAEHLYIIIKGSVNEFIEEELHNVFTEMDSFDSQALIYGNTQSRFVVDQDLICYEMPKQIFLDLLQDYEPFQHYYMQDFVSRHQHLKQRQQQNDLTPFMVAKIDEIYLHTPCIVDEKTSVYDAISAMKEQKAKAIIVESPKGRGIVTDTNVRNDVLLGDVKLTDAIDAIATYPVITVEYHEFLFNALLLFTKHAIKRLLVVNEGEVVGILEQLDLLSHFANHSYLIAVQIEKAENLESLKLIQRDLLYMVQSLNAKGVKVRYIARLVNELNAKFYKKVFEMCVPEALRMRCALLVMGSEGRSEQLLRTDQDNALIIEDGVDVAPFESFMNQFSADLEVLGFPPCPGSVMVNNPYWRRDVEGFKTLIDEWIDAPSEHALQALSIFYDAQCVAGNGELLAAVKGYLFRRFEGRDDTLAHIAKAVLSFETPLSMFSGFILNKHSHANELDLKKGGIFPIVHGIRTMALQHKIAKTNTVDRIKALEALGIFDRTFASELIESFDTFLNLRLHTRLALPEGKRGSNYVNPNKLGKIERDLLKDSFKIVNAFKKLLTYHFHLNSVT